MMALPWFGKYSGESTEQLLALEGKFRTDSLVVAFEQAIQSKVFRDGGDVSVPERVVLAIESLEQEVNNGGYDQFFRNSSIQYAPTLVDALARAGCPKAAAVAERAIRSLGLDVVSVESIQAAMEVGSEERDMALNPCDQEFYEYQEDLAGKVLDYIRYNRDAYSDSLTGDSISFINRSDQSRELASSRSNL